MRLQNDATWSPRALDTEGVQTTACKEAPLESGFTVLDVTTGLSDSFSTPIDRYNDTNYAGWLVFSPASASAREPPPFILLLLGSGAIFFMRKRFVSPPRCTA